MKHLLLACTLAFSMNAIACDCNDKCSDKTTGTSGKKAVACNCSKCKSGHCGKDGGEKDGKTCGDSTQKQKS